MKTLLTIVLSLFVTTLAQAKQLDGNSPAAYFQNNPDAVQDFMKHVDARTDMSVQEKDAYKALVNPGKVADGAGLLEVIDGKTLEWFYSSGEEASNGLLHKVSQQSTSTSTANCKKWALCVYVSKSKQRLYAFRNGKKISGLYGVKISTARPGKYTPTGTFSIGEIAGRWRTSYKYPTAALYYAMQLNGHIFIHATSTNNYDRLGTPASAGCVRTHLNVATQLNKLMRQIGRSGVRVVVE